MAQTAVPHYQPQFGCNWSRTKYDQESLAKDLKQSMGPMEYLLDPNYAERNHPRLVTEIGWIGKQGISYRTGQPIVDTESDLFNLGRTLTRDAGKYRPECITQNCIGVINGCDACQPPMAHLPLSGIRDEFTRLSNPVMTMREVGINRFQPICLNPQDPSRWEHPGEIGINYRMIVKDNHVPSLPHLIDQTPALPLGGELPCHMTHPTCGVMIH